MSGTSNTAAACTGAPTHALLRHAHSLTAVVVAGADLFTSNCAFVVIAMSEGEVSPPPPLLLLPLLLPSLSSTAGLHSA